MSIDTMRRGRTSAVNAIHSRRPALSPFVVAVVTCFAPFLAHTEPDDPSRELSLSTCPDRVGRPVAVTRLRLDPAKRCDPQCMYSVRTLGPLAQLPYHTEFCAL